MSKVDQIRSRKPHIIFTSRMDAKYLATLALYWRKNDMPTKSISELVRLSLETFAELLTISNKVTYVQTLTDALEILDNIGLNPKMRNSKYIAEELARESINPNIATLSGSISPSHDIRTKEVPVSTGSPEFTLAKSIFENALIEEEKSEIEKMKEATKTEFLKDSND